MKRILFLVVLGFVVSYSTAQVVTRGLKGGYNLEKFPEISFVWNTANPNVLDKSQFILADEKDELVDFDFQVLGSNSQPQKKTILFLWEDMYSHNNQSMFTRQLLSRFFSETSFDSNDKFNVAVFNRRKDSKGKTISPLLTGFTSDKNMLKKVVDGYALSKERFDIPSEYKNSTDLYLAISEGIDLLKKEPSDRACFIVVVTAGLNMKSSGANNEMGPISKIAVDAGIPVYVVKYGFAGDTPEVNSFAEITYGLHSWNASNDVNKALFDLQGFYRDLDKRFYGNDYKITFKTNAKRDGKAHPMHLSVNKVRQPLRSFTAPDRTFGQWVSDNLLLVILIVVLIIALVLLAIWLIRRSNAERDRKIAENKAIMQDEIDKSNQAMEDLKRQQELEKQQQEVEKQRQQADAVRKAQEEEEARLAKLMVTKNMFPRLQCQMPENTFSYSITKPHIKIGRSETNDVVLPNKTVSGFHAVINYDGVNFEIVNQSKSYTQGVIVNGQFFQRCTLKSGDMIGLGEAVLTFYV